MASVAVSVVLVPSAAMTVVVRSVSQGLSARPGRHSQTVFDGAGEDDDVADGVFAVEEDEPPQESAVAAISASAAAARMARPVGLPERTRRLRCCDLIISLRFERAARLQDVCQLSIERRRMSVNPCPILGRFRQAMPLSCALRRVATLCRSILGFSGGSSAVELLPSKRLVRQRCSSNSHALTETPQLSTIRQQALAPFITP